MKRIFLIVCLITTSMSFAKKWDAAYISKLIAAGETDKVIDYYKGRYYGDKRDPQDAFKIAELYVKKKDYSSAMEWYDRESQLINSSKVNLFNYANTNRLMGEYQKALDGYLMYAALTGDVNKVMDLANQCEKILKSSVLSYNYKLENYTYNTASDETNVAVLRTNPVYVTIKKVDSQDEKTSYEIYQIVRQFENFAEPVKAYNNNIPKLIITSLSFTQDGNTVVFAAIEEKAANKKSKTVNERIYLADNLGGTFLNVRPVTFQTDGYSYKNPAFNTKGTAIYFSSNQPGSIGGFDIWVSKFEKDKWANPVNLGKLLNSKSNETNPFVVQDDKDNILYFSSDREGAFGGYDIYSAKQTSGIWQDVEMQPAPINSAGDELSAIYDAETKTGYVSSNRIGGKGGFDIYRFTPFNLKLQVSVQDTFSEKPIDYALIQVFDGTEKLFDGVTDDKGKAVFQINKDKNYTLKITKDGYRSLTQKINSYAKNSGDSVEADVLFKPDALFSVSKGATNTMSLENYIIFTGKVTDGSTNKPAKSVKMRMVNYTTQKLREVDLDATGKFEIKLMLNNSYKVIFENQENKITDEVTTFGLEKNSVKVRDYLLTGSKFKLTENRVYNQGALPTGVKISPEIKPGMSSVSGAVTNEPVTQRKIDSLKSVISGDKIISKKPLPTVKAENVFSSPETSTVQPVAPVNNTTVVKHTVQPKETMYSISKKYNISQDNLREWNKISGNNIKIGSELIVSEPDNSGIANQAVAPESENELKEITKPESEKAVTTQYETPEQPLQIQTKEISSDLTAKTVLTSNNAAVFKHIVQPKQTLYSISKMYNVNLDDLKEWNNITGNNIKSGSELIISANDYFKSSKQSNQSDFNNPEMAVTNTEIADTAKTETIQETYLAADIIAVKNPKKVKVIQEEKTKTTKKNIPQPTIPDEDIEIKAPETIENTVDIKQVSASEQKVLTQEEKPSKAEQPIQVTETPKIIPVQEKAVLKKEEVQQPEMKRMSDIYFKVQLASYDQGNIKFPEFEGLGKIEEVKAYERYIYRLGDFETLDRAKEVLELVRSQGYFVAFILQYNKDKVTGIVK